MDFLWYFIFFWFITTSTEFVVCGSVVRPMCLRLHVLYLLQLVFTAPVFMLLVLCFMFLYCWSNVLSFVCVLMIGGFMMRATGFTSWVFLPVLLLCVVYVLIYCGTADQSPKPFPMGTIKVCLLSNTVSQLPTICQLQSSTFVVVFLACCICSTHTVKQLFLLFCESANTRLIAPKNLDNCFTIVMSILLAPGVLFSKSN